MMRHSPALLCPRLHQCLSEQQIWKYFSVLWKLLLLSQKLQSGSMASSWETNASLEEWIRGKNSVWNFNVLSDLMWKNYCFFNQVEERWKTECVTNNRIWLRLVIIYEHKSWRLELNYMLHIEQEENRLFSLRNPLFDWFTWTMINTKASI